MNTNQDTRPYYLRDYESARHYAITNALSHASTNHCSDRATVALIIRGASAIGLRDYAMREAMAFRAAWKTRLAIQQRDWQRGARRVSRCVTRCCSMPGAGGWKRGDWFYRHDFDKWITRENYVTGRDVRVYPSEGVTLTLENTRAVYGARARFRGLAVTQCDALAA